MIFKKDDRIVFDNLPRKCVCCDDEFAIFANLSQLDDGGENIDLEELIALSNDEYFKDIIKYEVL